MSETKWTPGPWMAEECNGKPNIYCDDATGSIVANAGPFKYVPRLHEEAASNARLIAAAPELYEALELEHQAFKDLYREALEEKPDPIKVIDIANRILSSASGRPVDTALAKARGEA